MLKHKCFYVVQLSWLFAMSVMASPPADVLEEARNSFIFILSPDVPDHDVPSLANELTRQHGGTLRHTFTTVLKGFSATIPETAAALMASHNPLILRYARNGVVYAGAKSNDKGAGSRGANNAVGNIEGRRLRGWNRPTRLDLGYRHRPGSSGSECRRSNREELCDTGKKHDRRH